MHEKHLLKYKAGAYMVIPSQPGCSYSTQKPDAFFFEDESVQSKQKEDAQIQQLLSILKKALQSPGSAELHTVVSDMLKWTKNPTSVTINKINTLVSHYLLKKDQDTDKILEVLPLLIKHQSTQTLQQCFPFLEKKGRLSVCLNHRSSTSPLIVKTFYCHNYCTDLPFLVSLIDKCGTKICTLHLNELPIETEQLESITKKTPNLRRLSLKKNTIKLLGQALDPLPNLKHLDLSHSPFLETLPNLSHLDKLEYLDVTGCEALTSINLKNEKILRTIYVNSCKKLKTLDLSGCLNLKYFFLDDCPVLVEKNFSNCLQLKYSNIFHLSKLKNLNFSGCASLSSLTIRKCEELNTLYWQGCAHLEFIQFDSCSLSQIPSFHHCPKLKSLTVSNCQWVTKLLGLADLVELETLSLFNCQNLISFRVPHNETLRTVSIKNCFDLTPNTIKNVTSFFEKKFFEQNNRPDPIKASSLAQSVLDSKEALELEDEDFIYKQAITFKSQTYPENLHSIDNPYHVYDSLTHLHERPIHISLPYSRIGNTLVRWNLPYLRQRAAFTGYRMSDIPLIPEDKIKNLTKSIDDDPYGLDDLFPLDAEGLSAQGSQRITRPIVKKWFTAIDQYVDSLKLKTWGNQEAKDRYFRSPIQGWYRLKSKFFDANIKNLLLKEDCPESALKDPQFHLHSILSAIAMMDSTVPSHDPLSEQLHALLIFMGSVQECATGKNDGLARFFREYVRLGLVKDVVNHALNEYEQDPKIARGLAWIDNLIQEIWMKVLSSPLFFPSLLRKLRVIRSYERIEQGSHQTTYIKNRFPHHIALKKNGIDFDINTGCVYRELFHIKPREFTEAFFSECVPELLINEIVESTNEKNFNLSRKQEKDSFHYLTGMVHDLLLGYDQNPSAHYHSTDDDMSMILKEQSAIHLLEVYSIVETRKKRSTQTRSLADKTVPPKRHKGTIT